MNIVVITESYYPEMSAAAACIDKYIQVLKKEHKIDVINLLNRISFDNLEDENIRVHFVSNFLWKIRIFCEERVRSNNYAKFYSLLHKLFKARSLLLSPFCYPSVMRWQIKAYYHELERLYKLQKIDAIISVSDPICCAFAALKFKKRHPEIKWIGYYTDPFTFQPSKYRYVFNKKIRFLRNYKNEKELYDYADYNLFTEEIYKIALEKFYQSPSKTYQIKYILNELPYHEKDNNMLISDTIKLVYAGTFLKDKRNPNYCLSILSKMPEINFDMFVHYSNCDDIISKYLSKSIRRFPSVDRERYCEIISSEYDILVNLGNNVTLQIPSKMFELLSTGRPIINFYQLKDIQYDMIEKYPLGLNIGINEPSAKEKILSFCKNVKGKRLTFEEVKELYPDNTLEKQFAIMEKILLS